MTNLIQLMAAPFAACVILVGIHAYLGMHVIQRRVIFVDLALAQIAALGATFSFLLGLSPHGRGAYFFALAFAVAGAAIFALTRVRNERVPQEAIIGIVYAVALALAILVANRAPEGAEHIQESLVGALLWVTWPTVIKTALIYSAVGAVHVALGRRFLQISFDPRQAFDEGRRVRLWDFIFYVTFAFVITSSVAIAGVLLVFSFLVIPAAIAALFAERIVTRLVTGWSVGILACLVGLVGSYRFDLPSGPAVVAALGLALLLAGVLAYVRFAESRPRALARAGSAVVVVTALAVTAAVFLAPGGLAQIEHEHEWEAGDDPAGGIEHGLAGCGGDLACEAERLGQAEDWRDHLRAWLADADPDERVAAAEVATRMGSIDALDLLAAAVQAEADPLLRLDLARILARSGDRRGFEAAVGLLADGAPPLVREDALAFLAEAAGSDFGYDPAVDAARNEHALREWRAWARGGG